MSQKIKDEIVIIGGGIIGLVSALNLQRAGLQVTIIADQKFPASYGNAGHIAIEQVMPLANYDNAITGYRKLTCMGGALDIGWHYPKTWLPWFGKYLKASFNRNTVEEGKKGLKSLLFHSVPAWERLLGSLNKPDLLRTDGHYVIYHDKAKAEKGCNHWLNSDIGEASASPMTSDILSHITNQLSTNPIAGLSFEKTGQISDISELINSCHNEFLNQSGVYVEDEVTNIASNANSTKITLKNNLTISCSKLLICAGARSGELLNHVGENFPVIAERGYHIEWEHDGTYDLPPLVFEDHSFIVTKFNKRLRLASCVEFTKHDAKPDIKKWERLEHYADQFGFSRESDFVRWFGSRPTLPDYRPVIGKSVKNPNLYYAFGHQHLGLTLAAVTGEIITDIITDNQLSIDISAFRPTRFNS